MRDRTQWLTGAVLRLHRGPTNKHELRLVASQTNRRSLNPLDSGPIGLQSSEEVALRVEMPDFASADGLRNDTQVARLSYEYTHVPDEFHYLTIGGTVEAQSGRFGLSTAFDQQRLNYAIFGEDRLQVFDNLQVTIGGRLVKNGPFDFTSQPRGAVTYELGRGFTAHGSGGFGLGTPTLEQRFGATYERRGTADLLQATSVVFDGGVRGSLLRGADRRGPDGVSTSIQRPDRARGCGPSRPVVKRGVSPADHRGSPAVGPGTSCQACGVRSRGSRPTCALDM